VIQLDRKYIRRHADMWRRGRRFHVSLFVLQSGLSSSPYGLCSYDVGEVTVYNWARTRGLYPYSLAPEFVRYVEGVAYVLVALATVDAIELTRYFPAERVGIGVTPPPYAGW